MATSTSRKLTPFLAAHEGFVSRAYRCPAGVVTIGFGFTMRSRVFAEWWKARYGRAMRMGDTITREDAETLLTKMLAEEYAPPVLKKLPHAQQHEVDGSASVSWNCGPGSLNWKWAQALARGDVSGAAALLKNTAVTANGRRLAGLVRRRKEEARIITHADYGKYAMSATSHVVPPATSTEAIDVCQYQTWLKTLGYYKGDIDGIKRSSDAAVRSFQLDHDLKIDGEVGPATRAALLRALDAHNSTVATTGAGGASGIGTGATQLPSSGEGGEALPLPDASTAVDALVSGVGVALVVAAVVFVAFVLWRNRGRFTGRRTPT